MEIKVPWEKGGGRILLGDTTSAEWSYCSWSGSSVFEFGFQLDSILNTYAFHHMSTQIQLVQNLNFASPCRAQLLHKRKSDSVRAHMCWFVCMCVTINAVN